MDIILEDFLMSKKPTYEELEQRIKELENKIAEQKETEQERTRLATVVDQAAESVVISDRDGTIRYINPAFERLSGFTRKEIFGQNIQILRSDKHDEAFYNIMWDIISRGEVWTGRITHMMKDGTLREFETTISPIRDRSGALVDFVFVKRDVTHEVQLQTRLQQAQKMEAIGTLAGGIAHDFNNILTSIIGFAELATFKLPEGDESRSDLDYVIKSGYRAKELVKQILSFSRRSEQDVKPVQIHLIIKEALKLLRASLPATIEIHQNIEFEFDVVLADPTQIHQVLVNLCTNAAYAMQESGGVLEVNLTEVNLDAAAVSQYPGLNPGPYLELSISDTGHGMDKAVLERIFDPFFTTKKQGEGTGMGLSVVHGIVKSHGGFVFVNSELGKGTKFHVFLPVVEKPIESEDQAEEPMPKGNERIMFVDDEVMLVTMAQEMLEFLGYEVVVRTSSIEALEAFRVKPDKFDLVITDKTMPQMTGFDLAKELREIRPDIPIILCTGFSETIETEMAKAMAINAYIMKPLAMQEMAAAVRKVLDK